KVIEDEAKIVKLIFDNFASREMNSVQLARYINDLGIKTKRGNPFEKQRVEYILQNPVYIGKARWTPTGKITKGYSLPDTIIRDSDHEPIIDIEVWDKAQERIAENKKIYRKHESTVAQLKTWLKGIVRCSGCGATLVVHRQKFMQCNGYFRGICKQSSHIAIEKLENEVLEELKKTYEGEIEINTVPPCFGAEPTNETEILQDRLNKIILKENRVNTAYEDGIDTLEEYKDKKNHLSEERDNLKKALELLKEKIIENKHNEEIIKKITDVYELLIDETVDIENKYQMAHFLINEITYNKPEKTLRLVYK
ncbi:MAG: recombinase family protein, partial [Oscillospiraceae bacterium]|nr:recombinase family protein [Oscillospiraceae bacterium]